jgi:hypothetical protein
MIKRFLGNAFLTFQTRAQQQAARAGNVAGILVAVVRARKDYRGHKPGGGFASLPAGCDKFVTTGNCPGKPRGD